MIKFKLSENNKRTLKAAGITAAVLLALLGLFFLFGKPSAAKWLYRSGVSAIAENKTEAGVKRLENAVLLDPKNNDIRLKLAHVYMDTRDYEKGEKLLLDGIKVSKSYDKFYKQLILLYVQSDRVEKALEFISQINHEFVLIQLNKERPSPIESTPTQGRYESAITVTLKCDEDSTIYYTDDGSTPNLQSQVYDSPIKINSGAVTVKAFAMNSKGLISDELILDYNINSENQYVKFADEKMEQLIRRELNLYNQELYPKELEKITKISNLDSTGNRISGDIKSLEDISLLPNLQELVLVNEKNIGNISAVFNQKKLRKLNLSGCGISKDMYSKFSSLEYLEYLNLDNNQISDLSFLSELKTLTGLSIAENSFNDLSPIGELVSLGALDISNNNLSDISTLQKLYLLEEVNLSGNEIGNLNNLASNTKIRILNISNCSLRSLSGLKRLKELNYLYADNNEISDLKDLKEFESLQLVSLSNNKLSTVSSLEGALISQLNLSNNKLKSIKPLKNNRLLKELDISYNKISSLEPLSQLSNLETLDITNNNITKLEPLSGCSNLKKVTAKGNSITDISSVSGRFEIEN